MATPHPHPDPRLGQLLLRWDELCDRGQTPDPAELCRDCPEFLPAFRQLLRQQGEIGRKPYDPGRMSARPRRRAVLIAAVAGVGLLLGLGLFLRPAPRIPLEDPFAAEKRRWDELDARLNGGEPITLIGDTGPPVVWRWGLGGVTNPVFDAPDAPFTVDSPTACLVELAPFPPAPSFVLRAEVRQTLAYDRGDAGVYFGHQRPGPGGGRHSFYVVSLATLGELAHQPRPLLPLATGSVPLDLTPAWPVTDVRAAQVRSYGNTCRFWANLHELRESPEGVSLGSLQLAGPLFFPLPRNEREDGRHALVVQVTPRRIDFSLDGRPIQGVDLDSVAGRLDPREAAKLPKVRPPTGALGLYLFHSTASFRRVTVGPLALAG